MADRGSLLYDDENAKYEASNWRQGASCKAPTWREGALVRSVIYGDERERELRKWALEQAGKAIRTGYALQENDLVKLARDIEDFVQGDAEAQTNG